MHTKLKLFFIWLVFIIFSAESNAATAFFYSLLRDSPDTVATSKPVVDLPPPLSLKQTATEQQKRQAEVFSQEAARYSNGHYPKKGCPPNPKEKLLNLYKAACLGEPTACTILARYYRTGEYGLGPDEARATMYEANMQWWLHDPIGHALSEVVETESLSASESTSRRSSDDSDKSTPSLLRHRVTGAS